MCQGIVEREKFRRDSEDCARDNTELFEGKILNGKQNK
jgi:hypothetical protein